MGSPAPVRMRCIASVRACACPGDDMSRAYCAGTRRTRPALATAKDAASCRTRCDVLLGTVPARAKLTEPRRSDVVSTGATGGTGAAAATAGAARAGAAGGGSSTADSPGCGGCGARVTGAGVRFGTGGESNASIGPGGARGSAGRAAGDCAAGAAVGAGVGAAGGPGNLPSVLSPVSALTEALRAAVRSGQ